MWLNAASVAFKPNKTLQIDLKNDLKVEMKFAANNICEETFPSENTE